MGEEKFEDEKVEVLELGEAIREAVKEKKAFLKVRDLDEQGISVVEITELPEKAYKKEFNGKKKLRMDLKVKALNGKTKGEEYILSIGELNIRNLTDIFGEDYKSWLGKKINIKRQRRGPYEFIEVVSEYTPIEGI